MQLGCERRRTASETGELESSRKAFTSARASQSARTIGTWPAAARRHGGITAPAGAHSPCPHWLRGRSGRSRQAVRTERLCCGLRATVARAIRPSLALPRHLTLKGGCAQARLYGAPHRWRGGGASRPSACADPPHTSRGAALRRRPRSRRWRCALHSLSGLSVGTHPPTAGRAIIKHAGRLGRVCCAQ